MQETLIGRPELELEDVEIEKISHASLLGEKPTKPFIDSIREDGILEPLILVHNPKKSESGAILPEYELKHGNRRLAAAREIGLETVPAYVYERGEFDGAALAWRMNNTRRPNPGALFAEIGERLAKRKEPKEIAEELRLTMGQLRPYLHLRERLTYKMANAFMYGHISFHAAKELAKLAPSKQDELFSILESGEKLTGATIKEARSAHRAALADDIPELFELGEGELTIDSGQAIEAIEAGIAGKGVIEKVNKRTRAGKETTVFTLNIRGRRLEVAVKEIE